MSKTVVITEEILLNHAVEAFENLNKIHQLPPKLLLFAGLYAAEITKTFFDLDKEN